MKAIWHRIQRWRLEREIRQLARVLLESGWNPARPETIERVIDDVRANAVDEGRVRKAEANVEWLRVLALEPMERAPMSDDETTTTHPLDVLVPPDSLTPEQADIWAAAIDAAKDQLRDVAAPPPAEDAVELNDRILVALSADDGGGAPPLVGPPTTLPGEAPINRCRWCGRRVREDALEALVRQMRGTAEAHADTGDFVVAKAIRWAADALDLELSGTSAPPPVGEPAAPAEGKMSADEAMQEVCETLRCEPDEVLETLQRVVWAAAPAEGPREAHDERAAVAVVQGHLAVSILMLCPEAQGVAGPYSHLADVPLIWDCSCGKAHHYTARDAYVTFVRRAQGGTDAS